MSSQAERLTSLEAYKTLLEKRLLDFDPKHPLPVTPQHLGLQAGKSDSTIVEMKRQLAVKEQDLTYTKQRNEKLQQEVDQLKKDVSGVQELLKQLEDEKNALLDYIEENIEKSIKSP